jgi:hypothetical protein
MSKHVGLFIDFENLIYGLVDRYGEQGAYELFKINMIFELARSYGDVTCAFAYADWRMRTVNQWQVDLYSRGVELVHVLGRGGKNAVDIRMAIDLVESVFTDLDIDTYLVVSGDRDFLPVIKLLKRRGKSVIALSPSRAMSKEMKRICNEAITYEKLLQDQGELTKVTAKHDVNDLLDEIVSVIKSSGPDGLTGAQLKQLLLQSRDGQFMEKDYGFISFGSLLDSLASLSKKRARESLDSSSSWLLTLNRPHQGDLQVRVTSHTPVTQPESADDLAADERSVYLSAEADIDSEQSALSLANYPQSTHQRAHELQLALSCLKGYQYVQNTTRRRGILTELYQALSLDQGVSWADALNVVCTRADLSRSQASKYHAILLQSQAFEPIDGDNDRPVKHRQFRLIDELNTPEALIGRYEQSVLHKVISRRGMINVELVADLLGLNTDTDLDYIQSILNAAHSEVNPS